MTQLGDCLKVHRQGFRLAKLQALQWIHLESMAWELLASSFMGTWSSSVRAFFLLLELSFWSGPLSIYKYFQWLQPSHMYFLVSLSFKQYTMNIAMPRRMKALRRIFSPSNAKHFVIIYLPNLSWEEVSNFLIILLKKKQVSSCSQSNTWSINTWN